ncbi:unnamed protein product [Effrenium voratum]|nr:unnamed protein product [Effrenium voratum]
MFSVSPDSPPSAPTGFLNKLKLLWLARYFLTYLAQGTGRVGRDYLKSRQPARGPSGRANWMQQIGIGAYEPRLCRRKAFHARAADLQQFASRVRLLVERRSPKTRQQVLAAAALITAAAWLAAGGGLLMATAMVSLGSAVVDGLTDGLIAAESTETSAAKLQSLCQSGHSIGALFVGIAAWIFAMPSYVALGLTAVAWGAVAPFALQAGPAPSRGTFEMRPEVLLLALLGFLVCLVPPADSFLYRQHVLGIASFQQPVVSIAGTVGWFACTAMFRNLSENRSPEGALRLCLKLWPLPLLAKLLLLAPKPWAMAAALLENAASEFGKALTFLPVTVLQQLNSPPGCEAAAFTLMQSGGTMGMVLGRNMEWQLLQWCGVDTALGAAGFAGYPRVVLVAAVWRVLTALAVLPILSCLNKKQSLSELLIFTVDAVAVVWLGNVGTIGNCWQMFADVWTMLVLGSPLHEA